MRKFAIALLAVCALAAPVQAVEMIGGAAGGYTITGPNKSATVYTATAGTVLRTFNENAKLFGVARMSGNEDQDTKWGVTALFATRLSSVRWLWGLLSAAAINDAFVNGDGTTDATFAIGAGLSAAMTPNLSLSLYYESMRTSGDAWDGTLWFAPTAHVEF
jgi:opacity protein-like surface antigen